MSRGISDRFNALTKRMEALPEKAGVALAVAVTQRLMDHYLLQPVDRRTSFVAHWAEMMPWVLMMVSNPSAKLKQTLKRHLKEYTEAFLGQEMPDYGQPTYQGDAGYACIHAIEAYCGERKGVACAAFQLLAHAQSKAQAITTAIGEDRMSTNGEARVLQFQHMELDRIENAVSLLEREGFSVGVLPALQDLLAEC